MYIKYSDYHLSQAFIHIPSNVVYTIYQRLTDDNGNSDGSIFIKIGDSEGINICDTDFWIYEISTLSNDDVTEAYEELLLRIIDKILQQDCKIIDVNEIEETVMEEKFEDKLRAAGYLE